MDLATIKDASIVVAGVIAFVTLWVGMVQYARQSHFTRANQFIEMRRRFMEDPVFRNLLSLIAADCPDVAKTPIQDRRNLVGFLEEVALLVNSGMIRPHVAHYMFGYYVLLIDSCDAFWTDLDRDGHYWRVFREFVVLMKQSREAPKIITI